MSAHVGVPAVTGDPDLPATLSRQVMDGLLRDELGFRGVTITDALDMRALAQGPEQGIDAIAAIEAGEDLLLLMPDEPMSDRIEAALVRAARRRLFDAARMAGSLGRIAGLRRRLAAVDRPGLEVVGCAEHQALAREVAQRSVTLVRDEAGLLPLAPSADQRVLAIMPVPADLTPADTSSGIEPALASALRRRQPVVEELVVPQAPTANDIAAARTRAAEADLVVLGTIAATFRPEQAELAAAVLGAGRPTVTVALRTPWELTAYPQAAVHVASYGILPVSLDALADALFGVVPFRGRLPVAVPGVAGAAASSPVA
jgi:beta-N-acetylhexosaminidase